MSMTYAQYVTSIANLMPVPETDPGFQAMLPNMIQDSELRIYRELDPIDTSAISTTTFSTGSRSLTIPSTNGTFIVTEQINVITPSTATTADGGTRNPLVPATQEMLNFLFPSTTGSTVPQYFSMVNQDFLIVGPWSDANYLVEVVGTVRPAALSSTNVTTILSVFFPDLLVAASMVFAAGYQKNFGAMVDDPKAAVSWESHYQELFKSANVEEFRKNFQSEGWSPYQPDPIVTPPRT